MDQPESKDSIIKIGHAENPEKRRKELSHQSNTPYEFKIYAALGVEKTLADITIFDIIDSIDNTKRIKENREFFKMSPKKGLNFLKIFQR